MQKNIKSPVNSSLAALLHPVVSTVSGITFMLNQLQSLFLLQWPLLFYLKHLRYRNGKKQNSFFKVKKGKLGGASPRHQFLLWNSTTQCKWSFPSFQALCLSVTFNSTMHLRSINMYYKLRWYIVMISIISQGQTALKCDFRLLALM